MAFQKGNKLGGRKPGSKNKRPELLLKNIEKFLHKRFQDLETDWDDLSTKERWRLFTDLTAFMLPRKAAQSNTVTFDQMSEEELDKIINGLKHQEND